MAEERIDIIVSLVNKFSAGMDEAKSKLEKMSKGATVLGTAFTAIGGAIIGFGAIAVNAYNEAEVAQAQLSHAVIDVTGATQEQLAATMELADELERKGVLDGDNIKVGLAQLSTFGLSNDAVQNLGGSLADLAVNQFGVKASGDQLSDSANMIAKALEGQFGVLEKSGIRFTEAQQAMIKYGTEEEKVMAINEGFQQNLKFTNEVAKNTAAGGLAALQVKMGNLVELIGKQLQPVIIKLTQFLSPLIDRITQWVDKHPKLTSFLVIATAAIGALMGVLGPLLILIGSAPAIIAGLTLAVQIAGATIAILTGPVGWVILAIGALMLAVIVLRKKFPEAWNTIVDVTRDVVQLIVDVYINSLIDGWNLLVQVLGNTGTQIERVTVSLDGLKVATEANGGKMIGYEEAMAKVGLTMGNLEEVSKPAAKSFDNLGGAAGKAGESVSEAMEKMGDAAKSLSKDIEDSLDEASKRITELQTQMDDLLVGKAQDTSDERMKLADAFVKQEEQAASLRADIGNEEDANKRMKMQEKLKVLEADLAANATIEKAFAQEINRVRDTARMTDLQKAKAQFQERITMINQEFEKKYVVIQAELAAELIKANELLNIREKAAKLAQGILLADEKATIESVNRQIKSFSMLALAVQNAKKGIMTGSVSLSDTMTAQQQLKTMSSAPSVSVIINNPQVLSSEDIIEKIGNPIIQVLKQHSAVA